MADRIIEVAIPSVTLLTQPTISVTDPPPNLATEFQSLRSEVSHLMKLVQKLTHNRSSSQSSRRSPRRSVTPIPSVLYTDALCWFHRRSSDQARNCLPLALGRQMSRPVTSGDRCHVIIFVFLWIQVQRSVFSLRQVLNILALTVPTPYRQLMDLQSLLSVYAHVL